MKTNAAEFQRQVAEATRLGEEELRTQPWASTARYDRRTRRLVVKLNKGAILSVPVNLVPELKDLADKDLASVGVLPPGFYLDWEHLDIQVSIAWLLTGMYGDHAVMSHIGRQGGSTTTKAKVKTKPKVARSKRVALR